jgi:acid phosphatase
MHTRHHGLTSLLGFAIAACAAACAAAGDRTGLLAAVVWTQTAAEHDALCLQVYAEATAVVQAAPEPGTAAKPNAVIVDVDETVLDNAPYQARLVLDQQAFATPSWNAWCNEARAPAIAGAVAFAQVCHARGVTVFYITNRAAELEAATRRNLAAVGFPLDDRDGVDVVLCKGDVDSKASKVGRRQQVTASFEVIAVVGDDLNDFTQAEATVAARLQIVREHAADWGRKWFQLPNPMYGSWERAAVAGDNDAFAGKRGALLPMR